MASQIVCKSKNKFGREEAIIDFHRNISSYDGCLTEKVNLEKSGITNNPLRFY
jgi:hypothetical protein